MSPEDEDERARPDAEEAERLRREQAFKADVESELAHGSDEEAEQATHDRRAAKAAYLEEKLEEQIESVDED